MFIGTKVFEIYRSYYKDLSHLAEGMGISVSQVSRVRSGKRLINGKFIAGVLRAFPQFKFEELFYLAPDLAVNDRALPAGVTSDTHKELSLTGERQPL